MKRAWTCFSLAFAALACMATVGVSTSFAELPTVLCTENDNPCEYESVYHEGEVLKAEANASSREFEIGITAGPGYAFKCPVSKLELTVDAQTGETLPMTVNDWSIMEPGKTCTVDYPISGGTCLSEATGLPYEAELSDAELTGGVLEVANPSFHFSCYNGQLTCDVSFPSLRMEFEDEPATLSYGGQSSQGNICFGGVKTKAIASGSVEFLASDKVYESRGNSRVTSWCMVDESGCLVDNRYWDGKSFSASAEGNITIANSVSDVVCTGSTLAGHTEETLGFYLPAQTTTWSLSGCSNKGGKSCTSTATEALPESGHLTDTASLVIGSGLEWKIVCSGISCTMTFEPTVTVHGGSTTVQLTVPESKLTFVGSKFLCPASATFKAASYSFSPSKPVYVSWEP